jgi:hypothetical protein
MRQNIKILTRNCCEDLQAFSLRPELREKYNQEAYDDSGVEFLKTPTKYYIDDSVVLETNSKDDCESSIKIFKQLIDLDKVQANDKRLWTCLTHTTFFNYTRRRWNINADSSEETIISRFHFEGAGIEARMRNSISRLWWTARITYDTNREDHFELTKLIWEKQDIHVALMERSFGTYPNFVHNFLDFYKKNKHLSEDEIRLILRGVNSIGGVKLLPLLNTDEVISEIKRVANYGKINVA